MACEIEHAVGKPVAALGVLLCVCVCVFVHLLSGQPVPERTSFFSQFCFLLIFLEVHMSLL